MFRNVILVTQPPANLSLNSEINALPSVLNTLAFKNMYKIKNKLEVAFAELQVNPN